MNPFPLKPSHKPVKDYYAALKQFHLHGHTTEGNTRSAFADLLKRCCSPYDWHLVEEFQFKGTNKQSIRADGALVDDLTLVHGLWEAKDTDDKLEDEIKKKIAKGYPLTNILFQSPDRAVLYQDNRIAFDDSILDPEKLVEVLESFFNHRQAHEVDWEEAVLKFSEKIPDLARGVTSILEKEYAKNSAFRENFLSFAELCRQSINPELTDDAIRKMLVQHLLTERIFRKVFNNQEFLSRNIIAVEIEKVIRSITARHFSRDEFLKPLDRFYTAIEKAAESQQLYTEKQHFLNAVYEKFFQRFDTKQADTHGIVYTPQSIVNFMVLSVEEILKQEFNKSVSDRAVHILDPFTGTGNFITRIMQEIKRSSLAEKYAEELHCNEIMLLPYYIASMNIEQAYLERAGEYRPFEGICLVDTFDTTGQGGLFSTENTNRIKRQMNAPIRVVIGNPPYNMGQVNENDAAKNRTYKSDGGIDSRVARTYTAASKATLRNKLSDPYVKAFRWATDRIKDHGVVCFISNNSFIDQLAFDGMRNHLARDFSKIYILDLGGNVRHNPKLSGTTHIVFGIQVGVAITFLIRKIGNDTQKFADIMYSRMPEEWRRGQKYSQLEEWKNLNGASWRQLTPDTRNTWLTEGQQADFKGLLPLGNKETKSTSANQSIFNLFSLGVASNRDAWVYNYQPSQILFNLDKTLRAYLTEQSRFEALPAHEQKTYEPKIWEHDIKWTDRLVDSLKLEQKFTLDPKKIKLSQYRPFCRMSMYFDHLLNQRRYQQHHIFPDEAAEGENLVIVATSPGSDKPFMTIASNVVPDLHLVGPGAGSQCFPFYTYDEDGTNRVENITDWALAQFRSHYGQSAISKWDIFFATYSVLHHPEFRARYFADLKRELPRIPFPPNFNEFAKLGKELLALHVDYEEQPEYPLEQIEDPKTEVTFRVERMSLSKSKTDLHYNDFLTLRGIPSAAFDYRLGNRSALEWVIDQYYVSVDPRSGIVNDPNRENDPKYILRLIGQVITVSLETQRIVASLPTLDFASGDPGQTKLPLITTNGPAEG